MLFLTAYILALVTLLVTPVVSAPINVQRSLGIVASYPVHVDFEKRSSIFRTLPHHRRNLDTIPERNVIGYSSLITRDEATTLKVRSSGDVVEPELAKRAEGQIVRLVRRKSIFTKIKEGFQKFGRAIKKGFQKAGAAIKKGFQKVGGAFKKAGTAIKKGFQKAGAAIKKGFQKFGAGVKKVAQKIGQGIKTAAKKVGHFIKTTGAKIAKFGLKIYATATKVVGRIASFIPGIGKPISKALGAVSKVANVASDAIHVSLGKKLDKGISVMNKIQNPVSGAAGAVLDAVMKRNLDDEHMF